MSTDKDVQSRPHRKGKTFRSFREGGSFREGLETVVGKRELRKKSRKTQMGKAGDVCSQMSEINLEMLRYSYSAMTARRSLIRDLKVVRIKL